MENALVVHRIRNSQETHVLDVRSIRAGGIRPAAMVEKLVDLHVDGLVQTGLIIQNSTPERFVDNFDSQSVNRHLNHHLSLKHHRKVHEYVRVVQNVVALRHLTQAKFGVEKASNSASDADRPDRPNAGLVTGMKRF